MKKKILITTFSFPPCRDGVSHVAASQVEGFARRGYDVTVVTGYVPERKEYTFPANVKVEEFDVSGNGRFGFRGGFGISYRGEVDKYQAFIANFKCDVIFCLCWQIWSTDLAVKVFAQTTAKKVLSSHGLTCTTLPTSINSFRNWMQWWPYRRQIPDIIKSFDYVTLLSDALKPYFDDLRIMDKIGYKNYSVIPNGADLERFSDSDEKAAVFRQKWSLGKVPIVLYISNYQSGKNQELAVQAFQQVNCHDAVLVLIGDKMNDYSHQIKNRFSKQVGSGNSKRVLFLEKLSQEMISAAYCAADVFLCTSRSEVQPLVILESIASGTPFVSTDVGCVSEIPGGIVVKRESELGPAVSKLLSDTEYRNKLVGKGITASRLIYNWNANVEAYCALFEKLCK